MDSEKNNVHNMASCMLSILDSIKLYDKGALDLSSETLSEVMFRKMKGYGIDLNEELGFKRIDCTASNYNRIQILEAVDHRFIQTKTDS